MRTSVGLLSFSLLLSTLAANGPTAAPSDPSPSLSAQTRPAAMSPALRQALSVGTGKGTPLRVWVYFRDKGEARPEAIAAGGTTAAPALEPRALLRRAKVRGGGGLVDAEDRPLHVPYVAAVRALVQKVRAESRWLNAVSVEASADEVGALAELECVASLDVVRGFRRNEPSPTSAPDAGRGADRGDAGTPPGPIPPQPPIYGASYRQVDQVNVLPLHQRGLTGRGVLVCMLDVGFRKSHEAFRSARLLAEKDFVMGDGDVQRNLTDPKDYSDAHGTATWSLLGGFQPGLIVGPAFGADFILGKTEDDRSETPIEEDYWVAGIEWAEARGADVVSSSLGYTDWYSFKDMDGKTAVTTRAADRAAALGVVVVNAAGNERRSAWAHIIAPADGFDVIAAGAVDARGRLASFSSPGPTADGRIKPDVCALGVKNFVAASGPASGDASYQWGNGTSYATPLVAGVVALLLEAHPDWTPKQVREALTMTASRASAPDNDFGWGLVNAAKAADYQPVR